MFDTRQLTIGAAATGIKSWVLPGAYQIAGIRVDNPSGSWIVLPDGTFIPPYTLGFGHSFQPMLSRIDVLFSAGPAGQVSTQHGDKPTVVIYSEPVGESPGVPSGAGTPFLEQFTPVLNATIALPVTVSVGGSSVVFAAVANKRIRILTCTAVLGAFFAAPPANSVLDVSIFYRVQTSVTFSSLIVGRVARDNAIDARLFPGGLDCPISEGLTVTANLDWNSDSSMTLQMTALLI